MHSKELCKQRKVRCIDTNGRGMCKKMCTLGFHLSVNQLPLQLPSSSTAQHHLIFIDNDYEY